MRKMGLCVVGVCLVLLTFPAVAQDDGGNISEIWFFSVNPGMEKQFMEGYKRHMEWHRAQNDTWSWIVWEVLSGDAPRSQV